MRPKILVVPNDALTAAQYTAIVELCSRAYEEEFSEYMQALAGGTHLLIHEDDVLVSHACWVDRWLQQAGHEPLRTAYVEAVATAQERRGLGYARTLMHEIVERTQEYALAALSPADTRLYELQGWLPWRGPLSVRTDEGEEPAPEEEILYRTTRHTPDWLDPDAPLSCEHRNAPEQW